MPTEDMRLFDPDFLRAMTEDEAVAIISNMVYQASHLFERLESVRKVRGNGHHMMQQIAESAQNLMRERWVK